MFSFDLKFDDFEQRAKSFGAAIDQVPFALANAMTTAAFKTREILATRVWPDHVQVRNRSLMRAALRVEKATKANLTVAVVDGLGREFLKLHAEGGTRRPHKGRRLAIPPSGSVKRGAKGIAKGQLPRAIVAATPKRALRITEKGIYVGEGGRLHLRYAFSQSATQKKDVPFHQEFAQTMMREMRTAFPTAIAKAMRTRR